MPERDEPAQRRAAEKTEIWQSLSRHPKSGKNEGAFIETGMGGCVMHSQNFISAPEMLKTFDVDIRWRRYA